MLTALIFTDYVLIVRADAVNVTIQDHIINSGC